MTLLTLCSNHFTLGSGILCGEYMRGVLQTLLEHCLTDQISGLNVSDVQ